MNCNKNRSFFFHLLNEKYNYFFLPKLNVSKKADGLTGKKGETCLCVEKDNKHLKRIFFAYLLVLERVYEKHLHI